MYIRSLFAACAAVVLCASLVETAQAYPIKARSGTTTVTGTYRPLDLSLSVVESADGFDLDINGYGSLTATMTGTYDSVGPGYVVPVSGGDAGNWRLNLFFNDQPGAIVGNVVTFGVPNWASSPYEVGTLRYLGGGSFGGLPAGDTPQVGDKFELFAEAIGPVLEITCSEAVATCGAFTAKLLQALTHVGPYVSFGEEYELDDGTLCTGEGGTYSGPCALNDTLRAARDNNNCAIFPCTIPTSEFRVAGANIPEPASLALVGLALAALGLGRRRRLSHQLPPPDSVR